jgi:cellobiose phosphorylase
MTFLHAYSNRRLLGDHVPYPVEAYPEGSQRHLSAESGLYCRVFTEGLFGIRPTGFQSFRMTPRLPEAWPYMRLRHVRAFGHDFDIVVERAGDMVKITISENGIEIREKLVTSGDEISFEFPL